MADKPEPQRLGVPGFRAFGAMGGALKEEEWSQKAEDWMRPAIDWEALAKLPPFQLFIWQRQRGPQDADWHQWARERMVAEVQQMGEQAFFEAYCAWHAASGKWPRETPLGKLRG